MPPPDTFVTVRNLKNNKYAYNGGALYPLVEHGILEDEVKHAKTTGPRQGLVDKATWCYQMALTMFNTHFTDIKPAHFVLSVRKD